MHDFGLFLNAVFHHWGALVSGVFGAIIGIIEKVRKQQITMVACFVFCGMCLFFACYVAWDQEHANYGNATNSLSVANAKIADLRPHFKLQVPATGSLIFERNSDSQIDESIVPTNGAAAGLIFQVEIYNTGGPSVTRDWRLTIHTIDGQSLDAKLVLSRDLSRMDTGGGNLPSHFTRDDLIIDKTKNNPIVTGGMQDGYVMFAVPQTRLDYLKAAGTIYEFSFRDVWDMIYSAKVPAPVPKRN